MRTLLTLNSVYLHTKPIPRIRILKNLKKTHVNNRHSAEGFAHRLAADLTRVEQTGEWFFITDEQVSTVLEQVKLKF